MVPILFLFAFVAMSAIMLKQLITKVGGQDIHYLQAFITALITTQATAAFFFAIGAYYQNEIDAAKINNQSLVDVLSPIMISASCLAIIGLTLALHFIFSIQGWKAFLISFIINGVNGAFALSVLSYLAQLQPPEQ